MTRTSAMTPAEFIAIRETLGLTKLELGRALRLTGDCNKTVDRWEKAERAISGPVAIAMECFRDHGLPGTKRPVGRPRKKRPALPLPPPE